MNATRTIANASVNNSAIGRSQRPALSYEALAGTEKGCHLVSLPRPDPHLAGVAVRRQREPAEDQTRRGHAVPKTRARPAKCETERRESGADAEGQELHALASEQRRDDEADDEEIAERGVKLSGLEVDHRDRPLLSGGRPSFGGPGSAIRPWHQIDATWVPALDLRFHLGVDGLSYPLVVPAYRFTIRAVRWMYGRSLGVAPE